MLKEGVASWITNYEFFKTNFSKTSVKNKIKSLKEYTWKFLKVFKSFQVVLVV
jgi:hypothetical protein